jgi:hypothetical protein
MIAIGCSHRNLSSCTRIALVLRNFFWRKHLAKSQLSFTLNRVIYFIGTILQGSTKPSFAIQNKKFLPFSNMPLPVYINIKISMAAHSSVSGWEAIC